MSRRWPKAIDDAIREAVARGERYSVTYVKLKAGTLPELAGPIDMPERTFAGKWSRAKREQGAGRCRECGQPLPRWHGPKSTPKPTEGGLLQRIAADLRKRETESEG